ncbi:MAG: heme ABC transporter permease [Gammaproteobacteria bacterium]|nr:heme ABC transporter permease [Gammaproteobacteria bacterium]
MTKWFHLWGSPPTFFRFSGTLGCVLGWPALVLILYGLYLALFLSPPDYQMGDAVRMMYVHVPAAWLSLFLYVLMAGAAAIGLIWRMKVAHAVAAAAAPVGAMFTFLALVTGSIWGKPMWGTWWVWDARLTSELILLFLYLGVMLLRGALPNLERGDKAAGLLAVVGVVNVPIIHYSVVWWNTLHQTASVSRLGEPAIQGSMLSALLVMMLGFTLFALTLVLSFARSEVLLRDARKQWVRDQLLQENNS